MRVLAVDPGGTTGMARYVDDPERFESWTVEGQMAAVQAIRKEALPSISLGDLRQLAGLLEADGCFTISEGRAGIPAPRIELAMSDRDVVEWAAEVMGAAGVRERKEREGRKKMYATTLGGQRGLDLMLRLHPYLGQRRRARVEELLERKPLVAPPQPLDVIVIEKFTISAATARKTRAGSNTAIEIIGSARWIAHARGVPFVEQTPADAMSFMTDEKLRRLGLYTPGPDHARDAMRHLLLYLLRSGAVSGDRVLPSDPAQREET